MKSSDDSRTRTLENNLRGRAIAPMTNLPFCVSNAAITELALRRSLAVRMSSRGERVKSLPHPRTRRAGLQGWRERASDRRDVRASDAKRKARCADFRLRVSHRSIPPSSSDAARTHPSQPFFPFQRRQKELRGWRETQGGRAGWDGWSRASCFPSWRRNKTSFSQKKIHSGPKQ